MTFGIDTFVSDQMLRPTALGRAIEERGFESLLVTEHSHIPARRETPWPGGPELPERYYRTYDPFVALAAVAAVTTRLRIGTAIALAAQRDVIHLAKEVATLDQISDGRVLLGVGAGWLREETRNHGIPPAQRGVVLDDKLAALRAIWANEPAEYHGRFVDFDPIHSRPKPVQSPHPPILVGGESRAALDRLANYGDGWLPRARTTPAEIRRVRSWLADQGRPKSVTVCGVPPERRALESFLAAGADRITFTLLDADPLGTLDRIAALVADLAP